jgi:molybdenum-dependent DNA-binding transcriptional regulator ModE
VKSTREQYNIIDAYQEMGSLRAAARLYGVSDRTVKWAVERQSAGAPWVPPPRQGARNTDPVMRIIEEKVRQTDGRISAKRLLPKVQVAGYTGSARNLRRAVARAKSS